MSIYVYCPRPSNGALELVRVLGAKRLRNFDGLHFRDKGRKRFTLAPGDTVVCWGTSIPEIDGVRVLNGSDAPIVSKARELRKLQEKGIACVRHVEVAGAANYRRDQLVPRLNNHVGGADILAGVANPDYYTIRVKFTKEYRIHSFAGRSIRAGEKVMREGFTLAATERDWKPNQNLVHPWVRSFDGGWRINYDGFQSSQKLRRLAHAATAAIGLKFAAIDIGETAEGSLYVLEVNRAPGIEGNSIAAYGRAINRWIEKGDEGGDVEPAPRRNPA